MARDKLAFVLSGTRGDVQPLLVLASELDRRGLPVVILTHASYRGMVEAAGLQYRALAQNPTDLLVQSDGGSALRIDRNWARTAIDSARYARQAQRPLAALMQSAHAALHDVRVALAGLPTLWMSVVAPVAGCALLWAFLQPVTATGMWPSAVLPVARLPHWLYKPSHAVANLITWLPWRATYARWLRGLGLRRQLKSALGGLSNQSVLYVFSSHAVPRPHDWPIAHRVCGFWRAPSQQPLPDPIMNFIGSHKRVIYVGYGSPGTRRHMRLDEMAQSLDVGIVAQGTGEETSPRVMHVADVPHGALFQRMAVIAHHGGAGTTCEALHAGRPQLIMPGAVDQFFWAARMQHLGVAGEPVPQRRATPETIEAGLHQALHDPTAAQRAALLAEKLAKENGVAMAADDIQQACFAL